MPLDNAVALIDLASAKAFLKITGSSEDTIVGDLVNGASKLVNDYTGRNWLQGSYTEYYDGHGDDRLMLNNFPVTALSSVNDDPNREFAGSTAVDITTDLILDSNAGIIRVFRGKPHFLRGVANVKVVYTAGYTQGTTSGGTMPYDIRLAVELIVAQIYKIRYASQRFGVKSETIADRTVTFDYTAIPDEAKEILDHHKEIAAMVRGFA